MEGLVTSPFRKYERSRGGGAARLGQDGAPMAARVIKGASGFGVPR